MRSNKAPARKKAADLQANIDLINGQLMPLQLDLAIAQGQQQIVQAAINAYQEESKELDDGWKDVQSKVDGCKDLMKQIASARILRLPRHSLAKPPAGRGSRSR